MNSLEESCKLLKVQYDNCFDVWFKDYFLAGKGKERSHDIACGKIFKEYQNCLNGALEKHNISKEELLKNILGTSNEKKS